MCTIAVLNAQTSTYQVARTHVLGAGGAWNYIVPDPPTRGLFIARQTPVMVDEDRGNLLGQVRGLNGAHGTAIAASSGHGFATSGSDGSSSCSI